MSGHFLQKLKEKSNDADNYTLVRDIRKSTAKLNREIQKYRNHHILGKFIRDIENYRPPKKLKVLDEGDNFIRWHGKKINVSRHSFR